MFYSALLFMFLFLEIIFGSFLISKYVCSRNNFFESNFFGRWMIGFSVYFGLSIILFFPFSFFISSINIIYLIVIFFLKDFFMYLFLFLRRNTYLKFNKEFLFFGLTVMVTLAIWFIYYFALRNLFVLKEYQDNNIFNFLNMFQKVLANLFFTNGGFYSNIFLQFLTIIVAYNVVMTFIYEISSSQSIIEWVTGVLCSLLSIFLFNFQREIQFNFFMYIILFSLILVVRFVLFSRRRYAIMFGLSTIIAYSFDRIALIPLSVISLSTITIYSFLEKPKISLFWIVLLIPILLIISLGLLYRINNILSMIVLAILIYTYISVLNTGRNIAFARIDSFVIKYKFFIPIIAFSSIFLFVILELINNNFNIDNLVTLQNPIFSIGEPRNQALRWIEFSFYVLIGITFIGLTFFLWLNKKGKLSKMYLMMLFLSSFLVFFYNPFSNIAFQGEDLSTSFSTLKPIIFIPLLIISINSSKEQIKTIILKRRSPQEKNIKFYYN